jgi:hypothetical protein
MGFNIKYFTVKEAFSHQLNKAILVFYFIKALNTCPRREFKFTSSRLGVIRSDQMAS